VGIDGRVSRPRAPRRRRRRGADTRQRTPEQVDLYDTTHGSTPPVHWRDADRGFRSNRSCAVKQAGSKLGHVEERDPWAAGWPAAKWRAAADPQSHGLRRGAEVRTIELMFTVATCARADETTVSWVVWDSVKMTRRAERTASGCGGNATGRRGPARPGQLGDA